MIFWLKMAQNGQALGGQKVGNCGQSSLPDLEHERVKDHNLRCRPHDREVAGSNPDFAQKL